MRQFSFLVLSIAVVGFLGQSSSSTTLPIILPSGIPHTASTSGVISLPIPTVESSTTFTTSTPATDVVGNGLELDDDDDKLELELDPLEPLEFEPGAVGDGQADADAEMDSGLGLGPGAVGVGTTDADGEIDSGLGDIANGLGGLIPAPGDSSSSPSSGSSSGSSSSSSSSSSPSPTTLGNSAVSSVHANGVIGLVLIPFLIHLGL